MAEELVRDSSRHPEFLLKATLAPRNTNLRDMSEGLLAKKSCVHTVAGGPLLG
jgi:hypothetical protein